MSWEATSWAIKQRAGGTGPKAVLLVLAEHADRRGLAYPSTRLIADEAECGQSSVRRHLDELRGRRLVDWTPGVGRGASRYQLALDRCEPPPLVSHPDGSQVGGSQVRSEPLVSHPDGSQEAVVSRGDPVVSHADARAEGTTTTRTTTTRTAAAARATRRGSGRSREAVTPAELDATAHSPTAAALVTTWARDNPGVLMPQRRELSRAVDQLIRAGADPDLIPTTLDEVHRNPEWRNPVASLRFAYERVRRVATAAANPPVNGHRAPQQGTASQRAGAFLALRTGEHR